MRIKSINRPYNVLQHRLQVGRPGLVHSAKLVLKVGQFESAVQETIYLSSGDVVRKVSVGNL